MLTSHVLANFDSIQIVLELRVILLSFRFFFIILFKVNKSLVDGFIVNKFLPGFPNGRLSNRWNGFGVISFSTFTSWAGPLLCPFDVFIRFFIKLGIFLKIDGMVGGQIIRFEVTEVILITVIARLFRIVVSCQHFIHIQGFTFFVMTINIYCPIKIRTDLFRIFLPSPSRTFRYLGLHSLVHFDLRTAKRVLEFGRNGTVIKLRWPPSRQLLPDLHFVKPRNIEILFTTFIGEGSFDLFLKLGISHLKTE